MAADGYVCCCGMSGSLLNSPLFRSSASSDTSSVSEQVKEDIQEDVKPEPSPIQLRPFVALISGN